MREIRREARRVSSLVRANQTPYNFGAKKRLRSFHFGAAGVIASKLLRPWRRRFFWLSLLPTLRLRLSLAAVSSRRRATSLLQLLLRLLVLLWRRRLTTSTLHSVSLSARFIHLSSTDRRRDLLMQSGRRPSARLAALSCAHRCPGCGRPEPHRFRLTLWRILRWLTLPLTLLLTWSSRWLATMFRLRRRLKTRWRCCSPCSCWPACPTGPWRPLAGRPSRSATLLGQGRETFTRSRRWGCHPGTGSSAGSATFKGRRRHASCESESVGSLVVLVGCRSRTQSRQRGVTGMYAAFDMPTTCVRP